MGKYTVLNRTRQTESFGKKARILDVSVDEQVDMLNAMYKGKVVFGKVWYNPDSNDEVYTEDDRRDRSKCTEGIQICNVANDVLCIELPECDSLCVQALLHDDLLWKKEKSLMTIKMPKCLDKLVIDGKGWQHYVTRIFVWDTTELVFKQDSAWWSGIRLELVAILSSSGGKNKVIKVGKAH